MSKLSYESTRRGTPKKQLSVWVPEGLYRAMDLYAQKHETTITAVVLVAVDKYLEARK